MQRFLNMQSLCEIRRREEKENEEREMVRDIERAIECTIEKRRC